MSFLVYMITNNVNNYEGIHTQITFYDFSIKDQQFIDQV